ncbi:uncharacterized protein LOC116717733 isoform X2 [Xiphophorus hellerii]|uniref:uncharacterized protein LOC116717733 isoform X2 n=1 Tax=Xiphophorus hellerii TaxID=8084 RepID=UPI0013B46A87|nr:uncharacterized protein LOC116717733 isoform X2 [Xiphophorus hellerii]
MAPGGEKVFWGFMFLLAGAAAQTIRYQFGSTCAVRGSTVILPCYFTPLKSFSPEGRQIPLRIVRVRWCKNHPICQGTTPSVYDSNSTAREPRFHYLGNMEAKCTLQIRDIKMEDMGTFRFRMEADNSAGHFTNPTGVTISVADLIKMEIKSSSKKSEVSRGQTVSLQCITSTCTFTHLEVTWRKDGHALPGNGSALRLGPLTAKDSGNYSCALTSNMETQSEPFSLQVEEEEEEEEKEFKLPLAAAVTFGVLLVVTTLILLIFIFKRKRTAAGSPNIMRGETEMKTDHIYSNVLPPLLEETGSQKQEVEAEEISYASVQFKHSKLDRKAKEESDPTIYSSVASRG